MLAYFKIYRPLNLLFIGIAQLLVAYFLFFDAQWHDLWSSGILFLVIGTVTIAAFGYWLNDYYDYERDQLNERNRMNVRLFNPLVLIVHLLAFLFVIFYCANRLNLASVIIFISSLAILWIYNLKLKDVVLIGNVLVALLSFVSIYMLAWLYPEIDSRLLLHFAMMAGMLNFCREIIKDAEDIEGDARTGSRTLAVIYGKATSNKMVYYSVLFTISFLVISLYYQKQYFEGALLYLYWSYNLLFVVVPLYKIALDIRYIHTKQEYAEMSNLLKYVIFTGIISLFFF